MAVQQQTEEPAERERSRASAADLAIVEALRRGDETAFVALVERHQASMLRFARLYVSSAAVAEEVVQEVWLGVLNGIDRFEGRSSLKTWMFHIVSNRARTRGAREQRSIPFSALEPLDPGEPSVDPSQFQSLDDPHPGHWNSHPGDWHAVPEERLLAREIREQVDAAIATLPAIQQAVMTLRDIEGWTAEEVCNVLSLTDTNQRVLLHRARSKVRRMLSEYLADI